METLGLLNLLTKFITGVILVMIIIMITSGSRHLFPQEKVVNAVVIIFIMIVMFLIK